MFLVAALMAASRPMLATEPAGPPVSWYLLKTPGPAGHSVDQASDLCYGKVGGRQGLWTVCDRNGGESAGRIYLLKPETLAAARPGSTLMVDEEFVIVPPRAGWDTFRSAHSRLGHEVLDHIQQRATAGLGSGEGQRLDLEAITIAPGSSGAARAQRHLYVVAEEPYSLILELAVRPAEAGSPASPSEAELVAAFRYLERADEHGADWNDGLEGLAYTGTPGSFWWAEEGTALHKPDAHPRLFLARPRFGRGDVREDRLVTDEAAAVPLTRAVQQSADGASQTLNALTVAPDGQVLAIDRNGGWVLRVDPRARTATRWFSVYNIAAISLRTLLAKVPGPRNMPYVSIEGLALDPAGDVWLCDDPAMPEPFRASCLVRISRQALPPATAPASP
jgi:hypothetical protein